MGSTTMNIEDEIQRQYCLKQSDGNIRAVSAMNIANEILAHLRKE